MCASNHVKNWRTLNTRELVKCQKGKSMQMRSVISLIVIYAYDWFKMVFSFFSFSFVTRQVPVKDKVTFLGF